MMVGGMVDVWGDGGMNRADEWWVECYGGYVTFHSIDPLQESGSATYLFDVYFTAKQETLNQLQLVQNKPFSRPTDIAMLKECI